MKKKILRKLISVILAAVMLATAMPVAFAATPVTLTQSNVTEWPKATPKLTEGVFFGQIIGNAVELTGGVVTYNGATVSGHFEFVDPNSVVSRLGSVRCDIKFVPDNTDEYTGFETLRNRNVTFIAQRTTPILKDENNPPVASGSYEPGVTLSSVTISGGAMVNPYNAEESKATQASWKWVNPDTVIYGSGEYEASYTATDYNTATLMVYVEINSPIPVPEISETPVVEPFDFAPGKTWGEIEVKGGKATADGTEVAGTFAVTDEWKNVVATPGTYEIDVVFTPDDETQAFEKTFKITVTVNVAPITFETEDGTGIPTITVDYGKKTNDDMGLLLKKYVPEDVEIQYIDFRDLDGNLLEHANKTYDPGTYTFTCRARTQNKNYATTMLTFKVVINKAKINPKIEGNGHIMIIRDTSYYRYNPKGTFDLYVNDKLVKEDIPYNTTFTYEHTSSGDKVFKAVYKPGDDNRYEIDPITRADGEVILSWMVVANNADISNTTYAYNSEVKLTAPATDPATPDKPYYGFAGWEDVKGNTGLSEEQLENAEITFTMPDGNVELNATYKFSFKLFIEWIFAKIAQFFTFIANAVKDIFALAA